MTGGGGVSGSKANPPPTALERKPAKAFRLSLNLTDVVMSTANSAQSPQLNQTKAALRGSDRQEVQARWRGNGACICTTGTVPCHRDLPLEKLQSFCYSWHSLTDQEKWFLTHSQYYAAVDDTRGKGAEGHTKVKWYLNGSPLCYKNFCHMIGAGPNKVRQYLTDPDVRVPHHQMVHGVAAVGRPREASLYVDFFFMELYNSLAEPLAKVAKPGKANAEVFLDDQPWLGAEDVLNPQDLDGWDPHPPDISTLAMLTSAASGTPPLGLRERYIQHTSMSILYWQFLSAWDSIKETAKLNRGKGAQCKDDADIAPPCYNTFRVSCKCVQHPNTDPGWNPVWLVWWFKVGGGKMR